MTQVVEIWQGTSVVIDYSSYTLEVDESYAFTWQSQITGNSNFLLYENIDLVTPSVATSSTNYASPSLVLTGSQYISTTTNGNLTSGTISQQIDDSFTAYVYFNNSQLASVALTGAGSNSVNYTLPSGSGTLTCTVKGLSASSSRSFTATFSSSTQVLSIEVSTIGAGKYSAQGSATYTTGSAGGVPISHTLVTDTSGNFNIDNGAFTLAQGGDVTIAQSLTVSGYVHAANNYVTAYSGTLRPTTLPFTYSVTVPAGNWAGNVYLSIFFIPGTTPYSYGASLTLSGAISSSTILGNAVLTDIQGGTSGNYPNVPFPPFYVSLTSTGGTVTLSFNSLGDLSGLTGLLSGNSDSAFAVGVNLYLVD